MSRARATAIMAALWVIALSTAGCKSDRQWRQPEPGLPGPVQAVPAGPDARGTPTSPRIPGRPDWADDPAPAAPGPGATRATPGASPEEPPPPATPDGPFLAASIQGSWQLVAFGDVSGRRRSDVRGALIANGTHLCLQFAGGGKPGRPDLRSVVRRYRVEGEQLRMTTLQGHAIFDGEEVVLDQPQEEVVLRLAWLQDGSLRIFEAGGAYLEFRPLGPAGF